DRAQDRSLPIGPNAILQESLLALLGVYGKSADKANPPAHTEVIGDWQMMESSAGYTTAERKALLRMTSFSLEDLFINPNLVLKGGNLMLDDGEPVTWPALSAEYLAEQFHNNP